VSPEGSPPPRLAPSSDAVSRKFSRQRSYDTTPELALRRALHRRGLRYRVHRRPVDTLRRTADVVFPAARVAVELRGCFWHACPQHGTVPHANHDWWAEKLAGNKARDRETEQAWRAAGWEVVVVWEHEDPDVVADRLAVSIRQRTLAKRRPADRG
jgi:DNA mismatch endonuclease (patch repair protein)